MIVVVMSLAMTVDVVKVVVIEGVGLVKRAGGTKVTAVTKMVMMSAAAKLEAMQLLAGSCCGSTGECVSSLLQHMKR